MIKTKQILSESDREEVLNVLNRIPDIYGDFYITKNNLRLFIRENLTTFLKEVAKGDLIVWSDEGIAVVVGIADRGNRNYVKIIASNGFAANDLYKSIEKEYRGKELWSKIKRNNPFLKTLEYNGWTFSHGRGKEVLMHKVLKRE